MPPLVLTSKWAPYHINCLANLFFRWIYAQFVAVDANFRLKLKNRGVDDPELGSGWSYFVENSKYTAHVSRKNLDEEEVSTFYL